MQLLVSYHLSLPFVLSLLQLYHPLCEVGTTVRRGGCNEDLKKILIKLIIFLAVLGLYCCTGFCLVAVNRGYSSCGVRASHWCGFSCCRAPALGHLGFGCGLLTQGTGSVVVVHGLSCSAACGSFPDQGPNPHHLHWQVDSLPLNCPESPSEVVFFFFKLRGWHIEVNVLEKLFR